METRNNWAFQWKLNFYPDSTEHAQEVAFSLKPKEIYHPPLVLSIILDTKLIFDEHLTMVSSNKTLGLLQKLQNLLPKSTPCLTLTGAIPGTSKEKLYQGFESHRPIDTLRRFNADTTQTLKRCRVFMGQLRRWYRKLGMFYKI